MTPDELRKLLTVLQNARVDKLRELEQFEQENRKDSLMLKLLNRDLADLRDCLDSVQREINKE